MPTCSFQTNCQQSSLFLLGSKSCCRASAIALQQPVSVSVGVHELSRMEPCMSVSLMIAEHTEHTAPGHKPAQHDKR